MVLGNPNISYHNSLPLRLSLYLLPYVSENVSRWRDRDNEVLKMKITYAALWPC